MAQVSRATHASSLATKLADNTSGAISAQDVREVITDLEDSCVWFDESADIYVSTSVPTVNNDSVDTAGLGRTFKRGDHWYETTGEIVLYICYNATPGAAQWEEQLDATANQTVTNKIFTNPTINGATVSGTFTTTSNGNITLTPNGTGNVVLGNYTLDADATVGVGQDNFVLTYDHTSGTWRPEAAAGAGGGNSWSDPVDSSITFDTDSTYDIGTTSVRPANIYTDSITIGSSVLDGTALADPNDDRLAGWDDSAGTVIYYDLINGLETSDTNVQLTTNQRTDSIQFVIDGGGSTITTGVKGYLEVPYGCTIQQVTLLGDQSGSIVVDIWKDTYANYPPVDADSITASAVPTISSSTKGQDSTLTGWTTSISAGDILGFNVDSVTTLTRVTVSLEVLKT